MFARVFPRAAGNVVGMVHALPMPGTPLYGRANGAAGGAEGGVQAIVEKATAEAKLYSGENIIKDSLFG